MLIAAVRVSFSGPKDECWAGNKASPRIDLIIIIIIIIVVVGVYVLIFIVIIVVDLVVHTIYMYLQSLYNPTIILNDIKMIQLSSEADMLDHLIEFILDCEVD